MRSNYKRLEEYIRIVDERNIEDKELDLLGVSTLKYFIPSIANTVGTNFKRYKIVKKRQFTYVPDTSRRGDKIGIALLEDHEEAIVSQAYTVFEVIDHNKLDPEYLMMWFRRPEFDRYARYKSHGSVREIFDWEEMCDVELPVPSIEKQRAIVQEYNTVVSRIQLNEQLNQKLEETAQALYKHWFVDFEFPISAEYAAAVGKPELEGQPYLSSGGKMVYNEELDQEIPEGWEVKSFTDTVVFGGGGTPSTKKQEFWNGEVRFYTPGDRQKGYYTLETDKKITELGLSNCSSKLYPKNTTFITARGATTGTSSLAGRPMAMNQTCYAIMGRDQNNCYAHQATLYLVERLKAEAIGATFEALVTKDFSEKFVAYPSPQLISEFEQIASSIYENIHIRTQAKYTLKKLADLMKFKMTVISS